MAKKYLFTVQRSNGHEILSATLDVAKVSDVEAQRLDDGSVRLVYKGDIVARGTSFVDPGEELTLLRRAAEGKPGKPTEHPVKSTQEDE